DFRKKNQPPATRICERGLDANKNFDLTHSQPHILRAVWIEPRNGTDPTPIGELAGDGQGDAVEDVVLAHDQLGDAGSAAEFLGEDRGDDRAAADDVDAAGMHRAERRALLAGRGDETVAHLAQAVERYRRQV